MTRNAAVGAALAEVQAELDFKLVPTVEFHTEAPGEEFRTLRTRLEQLRTERSLHTVLVTSASRGDGKSFTAANLALAEAQLADNPTLLCDFDLRHPMLHRIFGADRSPGLSDYLLGKADLPAALRRIANSNLFLMPAGE